MKHKKSLLIFAILFTTCGIKAQILDGTAQSSTFRISLPYNYMVTDGDWSASPYLSYKHDFGTWGNGTLITQYNIRQQAVITQLWLGLIAKERYYLLSRSIYNYHTRSYSHGLAGTIKLPHNCTIDATWSDMFTSYYDTRTDRFQVVGGYRHPKFIANAGYSMLFKPGIIANLRIIFSRNYFLQMKYDGGVQQLSLTSLINF